MPLSLRRLVFGSPFETHRAHHTRLPNSLALPVFASDALSSVAYATEETLLVLATAIAIAGTGVLEKAFPIGIAIAVLLAIVAFSYRQTIHAYPQGGGAYRVSRENLGLFFGLTAASALLLDYILTVAVSVSAGVAALTSAVPALSHYQVWLAVGFVVFIAMANLRGAKESGLLFAVPTYLFIFSIFALLITGFVRLLAHQHLQAPGPSLAEWQHAHEGLSWFLILRAFSSGCTALTGVEAVTDGVPAFKPPEAKNAARVLVILAVILITMFMGITILAHQLHVVPFPAEEGPGQHRHTVISQIAYAVFGPTIPYYVIQFSTTMILVLAANTAFVDFPRLSMFLAQDRLFPRWLANVGDRLVYSNGIIGLAVLAILTIIAFGASTHHLIPLYALGVFTSFTLSQAGMVARWFRLRPKGWQLNAAVNALGAAATFVVLIIVAVTKFAAGEPIPQFFPVTTPLGLWILVTAVLAALATMYHRRLALLFVLVSAAALGVFSLGFRAHLLDPVSIHLGAWIIMAAIPALVWMCSRINAHYKSLAQHLTMQRYEDVPDFRHTVLVLVPGVHRGVMPAIKYARSLSQDVRAVYVEIEPDRTAEVLERWGRYVPDLPLVVLESPFRGLVQPLMQYIDEVEMERDDDVITVVIPEFVTGGFWTKLLHSQKAFELKWALLFKQNVVVTNIRYHISGPNSDLGGHPLTSSL
jgi:amino acid transporter